MQNSAENSLCLCFLQTQMLREFTAPAVPPNRSGWTLDPFDPFLQTDPGGGSRVAGRARSPCSPSLSLTPWPEIRRAYQPGPEMGKWSCKKE